MKHHARVTRPTRVDHASVARALAEANAKTGLFKRGDAMPDTPKSDRSWLCRVPGWARPTITRTSDGLKGLGNGLTGWIAWAAGSRTIALHGEYTAAELRDLAAMLEPSASDPLDRVLIEAAREWSAADMDTDAQAGDRLSAAVRAYEAAANVEQRENDDAL